jgi:hypothetical protein
MNYNTIQKSYPLSLWQILFVRKIDRKTKISWIIVLFFLLILYLTLILSPFPDYQQSLEIELDEEFFEIFEPPPPPVISNQPEVKPMDLQKDLQMPSEDELLNAFTFKEFEETFNPGSEIIQDMEVFNDVNGGFDDLVDEMEDVVDGVSLNGLGDFLTGDDESFDFDVGLHGNGFEGDIGIEGGDGTELALASGSGGGRGVGNGKGLGGGKVIGSGTGVVVNLQSYGEDDYHGKDIVYPLIEWMKKHPKKHSYTMKHFLEYESGDLTSTVRVTIQNRQIEIYLRCTEKTRELAICIVDGENATKLIDQGISERSHRLEIGTVLRADNDNRIVNVISKNISPTREKTNSFMSIFLSWWNNGDPIAI